MHTDARELDNGSLIEGDVCIVGAGAAGISMAREWLGSSARVILLESGGFEYEQSMQELYRGEQSAGHPYYPLEAARLHYFGGTTGHWAGFCSTLDAVDFKVRDWVSHSGWPIRREELDPYYARANVLCQLGPYEYGADYWVSRDPGLVPLPLGDAFWTKMWQFSPPTRFGTTYRRQLLDSSNVHLYTYANMVELVPNQSVTAIDHLRIRTPEGREHRVRSKNFVMACGAIQNARLLLASNSVVRAGIGNDHDLVGRYFMEHIEIPGANMFLSRPLTLKMYLRRPMVPRGELSLHESWQRSEGVLNGTAAIAPGRFDTNPRSTFQVDTPERLRQVREAPVRAEAAIGAYRRMWPGREFRLKTRQEQAPNPASRVTLLDELDAMGVPRVRLDWQLSALDKSSIRRFYQLLGQALGKAGLGRLQLLDWLLDDDDSAWPEFLSGGWHHMGTTRMHDSPRSGVVDADCRVHGIGNLYIAGSGVFTTAGAANPTLTLIALSLRLADHLKRRMNPG